MSATIDEFTGLLSISSFIEQLESIVRTSDHLVLVVTDLDHLLSINEKYTPAGSDAWIDDRLETAVGRRP